MQAKAAKLTKQQKRLVTNLKPLKKVSRVKISRTARKKARVVPVESKDPEPVATDQLPVCANEPKIVVVRKARCIIGAQT